MCSDWQARVDCSVAKLNVGAGKSVTTTNVKAPIAGFVFDQKELMGN